MRVTRRGCTTAGPAGHPYMAYYRQNRIAGHRHNRQNGQTGHPQFSAQPRERERAWGADIRALTSTCVRNDCTRVAATDGQDSNLDRISAWNPRNVSLHLYPHPAPKHHGRVKCIGGASSCRRYKLIIHNLERGQSVGRRPSTRLCLIEEEEENETSSHSNLDHPNLT